MRGQDQAANQVVMPAHSHKAPAPSTHTGIQEVGAQLHAQLIRAHYGDHACPLLKSQQETRTLQPGNAFIGCPTKHISTRDYTTTLQEIQKMWGSCSPFI